jgi:hypothetical protein
VTKVAVFEAVVDELSIGGLNVCGTDTGATEILGNSGSTPLT